MLKICPALPPIWPVIPPEMTAESFVAKAVARTGAAVVRIDTEAIITRPNSPFFDDPFFQEFFGEQFRVPTQQRVAWPGIGFYYRWQWLNLN
jgi:S1-C subfamily serine protease